MSADDDTFDIDIYGDEEQQQPEPKPKLDPEEDLYYEEPVNEANGEAYEYDGTFDDTATHDQNPSAQTNPGAEQTNIKPEPREPTPPPQQGTKRKAPSDGEDQLDIKPTPPSTSTPSQTPIDPTATPALKLTDLNWWTTEEDLRSYPSRCNVESSLLDLTFAEHKINGKARGEAYLEFSSAHAAQAVKREIEKDNSAAGTGSGRKAVVGVSFSGVGNPYKTGAGAGVGAKREGAYNQLGAGGGGGGRGGAYNSNYGSQRGNYGGRGNYGQNQNQNRGGYNSNGGGMYNHRQNQQQQQQGSWGGMNGGGMNVAMGGFNAGGYAGNPMMGMMGNFNNMGRGGGGGMMPNMMGRGGGFAGGMGNHMGMGMNRGGGMMNGMNAMNGMMGRGGGADCASDGEEGAEGEGRVGGVGEVEDGFGGEGGARTTYIYILFQLTAFFFR